MQTLHLGQRRLGQHGPRLRVVTGERASALLNVWCKELDNLALGQARDAAGAGAGTGVSEQNTEIQLQIHCAERRGSEERGVPQLQLGFCCQGETLDDDEGIFLFQTRALQQAGEQVGDAFAAAGGGGVLANLAFAQHLSCTREEKITVSCFLYIQCAYIYARHPCRRTSLAVPPCSAVLSKRGASCKGAGHAADGATHSPVSVITRQHDSSSFLTLLRNHIPDRKSEFRV
jgi:hypothetical protein